MYSKFSNKEVILYNDNGAIVRRFLAASKVVSANVSGDQTIAIVCDNNHTYFYKTNGQLIRKS